MAEIPSLRPSILANLDKIVKDELASGGISSDAKWAVVATADNQGTKLLAAVNFDIFDNKVQTKVKAIWQHDWDGNDIAMGQVVFSGK